MKKPHPNNNQVVSVFIISMCTISTILYGLWALGGLSQDVWMAAMYALVFTLVAMFWDVVRRNGW